jgi:hypothetical protein
LGLRRLFVLSSIVLLWADAASALTVAVIRPPNPSPEITETLVRLRGELSSVGFDVKVADGPAAAQRVGTSSPRWLEALAEELGVDAFIDIADDAGHRAVDVWVPDKTPRRYLVSRVTVETGAEEASERLAIRAIEVLRSGLHETSFLRRSASSDNPSAKPLTDPSAPGEATKPANDSERLGLEVGAAAVTSLDGVGPAILPMLRLDFALTPTLLVQSTLAGLGTSSTVATMTGNALVAQQHGLVGGYYRLGSGPLLWPSVALSAGVLRTSVEGNASPPNLGHSTDDWSFLFDASLGAELRLHGHFFLTVAAHAQLTEPYVAIHFLSAVIATTGHPNLVLTLTVGAWL